MTITPPLAPEDDYHFNKLANEFAEQLAASFGYTLQDAEEHVRAFFTEYENSIPARRSSLKAMGVELEPDYSAIDYFSHEGNAVVLYLGYRLAGGNPEGIEFLDWRKNCWDALRRGERIPLPAHLPGASSSPA